MFSLKSFHWASLWMSPGLFPVAEINSDPNGCVNGAPLERSVCFTEAVFNEWFLYHLDCAGVHVIASTPVVLHRNKVQYRQWMQSHVDETLSNLQQAAVEGEGGSELCNWMC